MNYRMFSIIILLCPILASAADTSDQIIDWFALFFGLLGGLSLFLYGMNILSDGMKKSAGNNMRSILAALTKNRVIGLFVGAFVTTVVQSSSATTVMLVSFVQANLMKFSQTLGIILGADIGTTVTTQLIALKLTNYAIVMISIGFFMNLLSKNEKYKNIGESILGFGLLFYGMKLMSDAMTPLRTYQEFISLMKGLENPFLGVLIGTLFTALIQSSAAFIGIVIVLGQQHLITLNAGIPLMMGANVGTCITAALASIGTSREAKRVALAHTLFKIGGVALFIFWIPYFAEIVNYLTDNFTLGGMPRKIANAHTIFNVTLAIVFLPFTHIFAKMIYRFIPHIEEPDSKKPVTWKVDDSVINTPPIALDLARTEILRMARIINQMLEDIIKPFITESDLRDVQNPKLTLLEGLNLREKQIDFLEEKISEFLIKIGRQKLSESEMNEVYGLMSIASDLESIGDIIHRNLVPLVDKKRELTSDFTKEGKEEILIYHQKVCKQISRLEEAISDFKMSKAKKILKKVEIYLDLEAKYRIKHLERIRQKKQKSLETHEVHMELMDLLKQINVYAGDIAKSISGLSADGEETPEAATA